MSQNMHDMFSCVADVAFDPGKATQDSGANFDPLELPLVSTVTRKVTWIPSILNISEAFLYDKYAHRTELTQTRVRIDTEALTT